MCEFIDVNSSTVSKGKFDFAISTRKSLANVHPSIATLLAIEKIKCLTLLLTFPSKLILLTEKRSHHDVIQFLFNIHPQRRERAEIGLKKRARRKTQSEMYAKV
jgi:hypothetical protein